MMLFFFNDTATPEIYTYGHTLSLHDALPIYDLAEQRVAADVPRFDQQGATAIDAATDHAITGLLAQRQRFAAEQRSEEHTSELQSLMRTSYAVFCLKKKKRNNLTTKQRSTMLK